MSDTPPEQRPSAPAPDADPTPTQALPPQGDETGTPQPRFRDRVWGLRVLAAVAIAAVVLGGLAGAGIATVAGGEDRGGRFGPGPGRFDGRGPGGGGPPGLMREGKEDKLERWRERREERQDRREQRQEQRRQSPTPSPSTPTPTS